MQSFWGIIGHFIFDSELQTVMRACERFKGKQTAENIFQKYENTIAKYNISNKVSVIVTDNAANMVKAFCLFPPVETHDSDTDNDDYDDGADLAKISITDELDYLPPKRSPCFIHTVQLVVHDALEQAVLLKIVMTKLQRLTSFCHKTTRVAKILEAHVKLPTANATRRNSQLQMMRAFLMIPSYVLSELQVPVQFTVNKIKLIKQVCESLESFEEVSG